MEVVRSGQRPDRGSGSMFPQSVEFIEASGVDQLSHLPALLRWDGTRAQSDSRSPQPNTSSFPPTNYILTFSTSSLLLLHFSLKQQAEAIREGTFLSSSLPSPLTAPLTRTRVVFTACGQTKVCANFKHHFEECGERLAAGKTIVDGETCVEELCKSRLLHSLEGRKKEGDTDTFFRI